MKELKLLVLFIFSIFILSCEGKEKANEETKTTETVESVDSTTISDIENYSVELNSTNTMLEIFEIANNKKTKVLSLDVNNYGNAYWITNYAIYFQRSNKYTEDNPIRFIEKFDIQKNEIVSTPFDTYDLFAITNDERYICFSRPDHKKNTDWGPIYAQNIYIYDTEKRKVLHTYNVLELVGDDFYGGVIQCSYNKNEERFNFVFSLDAVGNYGTAYIDIKDYSFHRKNS